MIDDTFDLRVHDVALLCNVRDSTVREWLYQGKIEYEKIPDILPSLRISRISLLEFSKNYHHGRYFIDEAMIKFVRNVPWMLKTNRPELTDKMIDELIKKALIEHKEEQHVNQTNTSQL